MSSKFETTGESEPHSEEFRRTVREKIEAAVNSLLGKKLEEYVENHVSKADVEKAANHLFSMILEGNNDEEILSKRQEMLDDITKRAL